MHEIYSFQEVLPIDTSNKKKQISLKVRNHMDYFTRYIPLIWNSKIFGTWIVDVQIT